MNLTLSASPDELIEKFYNLKNPRDVADLLEIKYSTLIYYTKPENHRYITFNITKRSGKLRKISAPANPLKVIQQKLNVIFQLCYDEINPAVHGFIKGKNILTNALLHSNKKHVLNIDLKDFFPSINFGRVWGLFVEYPFNLPSNVSAILANLCSNNNLLPQGAPTSPLISNMICRQLDHDLGILAKKNRCKYSRYADDITFSTSTTEFPQSVASLDNGSVILSEKVHQIIEDNGFKINQSKIHLQSREMRQVVTGLTVNYKPNVNRKYKQNIRAMLHAWEKYGLDAAEFEHYQKYDKKHRFPEKDTPSYIAMLRGKIEFLGMIRGKTDSIYTNYKNVFNQLCKKDKLTYGQALISDVVFPIPTIFTEGKTDWKHL